MKSSAVTRTKALEIVLRFAAVKGSAWNLKTGAELIAEAAIVDRWILTGDTSEKEKSPARKARKARAR